jgi:hypothetical protein
MTSDPYEHVDAVYLIGALSEDERIAYEAHLVGCATCRARLEEARSVIPFLMAGDESLLADEAPFPETLLPRLLAQGRRTTIRRRMAVSAVAAAAAVLLVVTVALSSPHHTAPRAQPMTALVSSPVTATAALRSTAWGTEITLNCGYSHDARVVPGYRYSLTVHDRNGTTSQLGTWALNDDRTITFTAGTALPVSQIQSVDITETDGTAILELRQPAVG